MGLGVKRAWWRTKKWLKPELQYRFSRHGEPDYKNIPIVINNFNRLAMMLRLIDSLTSRGYHNIHIVDNASTYPPLLEWYESCPYTVYRLDRNVGHLAFWETDLHEKFRGQYIAYTDPDVEIHPDCPDDFMEKFVKLLRKYPKALKVGFSLLIDDLPDCYDKKEDVQKWESQFWETEVEPGVFKAPIDTTFAVYKPFFRGELINFAYTFLRVGKPYSVRHLPWYADSANPTGEDKYYISQIRTSTHWSEQEKK